MLKNVKMYTINNLCSSGGNIGARSVERIIMGRSMILPCYVDHNHIRAMHVVTPGPTLSQKQVNDFFLLFIIRRVFLFPVKI